VKVILQCTLVSGKDKSSPPGSIIEMDRNEALRLMRMKLVRPFDTGAEVDRLVPTDDGEDKVPTLEEVKKDLTRIHGIDDSLAAALYGEGITSVEEVAVMKNVDILTSFQGVDKKLARSMINSAKALIGK
jgi:hypothetical protein